MTEARAVVFRQPRQLEISQLPIPEPEAGEVLVEIGWCGISTGTERLLWNGDMPAFPGMGYPLVPGYESVGWVRRRGSDCKLAEGDLVFVPGATCFGEVRGLFGGAASKVVVADSRALPISAAIGEQGTLLALAATAHHALRPGPDNTLPELIIGHGVLGRLLARITVALGGTPPIVWETNAGRREGAQSYSVIDPAEDDHQAYNVILDASGDAGLLDTLVARLAKQGEIVLAGFYSEPLSFNFPPAFMREARLRIAAEWQPSDFAAVLSLVESGQLSLDGLITHRVPAEQAADGYQTAFGDPACLKMILDWREKTSC